MKLAIEETACIKSNNKRSSTLLEMHCEQGEVVVAWNIQRIYPSGKIIFFKNTFKGKSI